MMMNIALKVLTVVLYSSSWLVVNAAPKEKLSPEEYGKRKQTIIDFVNQRKQHKDVVKTTKSKSGETFDWIPLQSQTRVGKIATPPEFLNAQENKALRGQHNKALDEELPTDAPERNAKEGEAKTEVQMDASLRGPEGTVPVVRFDLENFFANNPDNLPSDPNEIFSKAPPPDPASNDRYYAYWQHRLDNFGSLGRINVWNVAGPVNDETSIAQVAVIRGSPMQAIEAGKIEHTSFAPSNRPTFFTYFRTSGSASGDNVGGYNALVDGWVQYSSSVAPGMSLVAWESSTNGNQYSLDIEVRLWGGNWWIKVAGEWAGYYPGSLFSASGIRDKADRIDWYGEVFDSSAPAATSTDMGSGAFANQGFGKAAYFRNMAYFWSSSQYWWFNSGSVLTTDSACYSSSGPFYSSSSAYRNWFYYGGPGKEASGCT